MTTVEDIAAQTRRKNEVKERLVKLEKFTPGNLYAAYEVYFSTIGFGGRSRTLHIFYAGDKGLFESEKRKFIDVMPAINPVTDEKERLVLSVSLYDLNWYDIKSLKGIPVKGSHRSIQAYNEGTFSPAGPTSWTEHESENTAGIIEDREWIEKTYKRFLDDMKFRSESLEVSIPSSYLPSGERDIRIGRVDKALYNPEISRLYAVEQVADLIKELSRRLVNTDSYLINKLREGDQGFNPELSAEYDMFPLMHGSKTRFRIRNSPRNGVVWVKPLNVEAWTVLQTLPAMIRSKFPEDYYKDTKRTIPLESIAKLTRHTKTKELEKLVLSPEFRKALRRIE